jgi:hypothetical protein
MPMNSARQKAQPVVSPPPPPAPSTVRTPRSVRTRPTVAIAAPATSPPPPSAAPRPVHNEAEDFQTGWELRRESWHFHRRFYAIFRRPMVRGEYSHLLWQIRRGKAEHLGEDCWRVTLPGNSRTLPIRATVWRLITILPKDWQPPAPVEEQAAIETSAA